MIVGTTSDAEARRDYSKYGLDARVSRPIGVRPSGGKMLLAHGLPFGDGTSVSPTAVFVVRR